MHCLIQMAMNKKHLVYQTIWICLVQIYVDKEMDACDYDLFDY